MDDEARALISLIAKAFPLPMTEPFERWPLINTVNRMVREGTISGELYTYYW